MQASDFVCPLLACPEQVLRLAQKLETAWMTFGLSRLLRSVPKADYQEELKTTYLTSSHATETSGQQLRNEQQSAIEKRITYQQA
jgi:hypothetical protein